MGQHSREKQAELVWLLIEQLQIIQLRACVRGEHILQQRVSVVRVRNIRTCLLVGSPRQHPSTSAASPPAAPCHSPSPAPWPHRLRTASVCAQGGRVSEQDFPCSRRNKILASLWGSERRELT